MFTQPLKSTLAAALAAVAMLSSASSHAALVSYNMAWTGSAGYSLSGQFSYDDATAPTNISVSGLGPFSVLKSLSVGFFDPSNNLMQSYATVVNGVSNSNFFQFNFDVLNENLYGSFNVGGGTVAAGVQFFNGTLSSLLRLRENIDASGNSNDLDSASNTVTVTRAAQVPEPGTLALCFGALLALGMQSRRRRG